MRPRQTRLVNLDKNSFYRCDRTVVNKIQYDLRLREPEALEICRKLVFVIQKIKKQKPYVRFDNVTVYITYRGNTIRGKVILYKKHTMKKHVDDGKNDRSTYLEPVIEAEFKFKLGTSDPRSIRVYNITPYMRIYR